MNSGTTTYQVNGLESDGCTLVSREAYTLKAARREAAIILTDSEYLHSGLYKVEIINDRNGDCEIDFFV